jgi:hypothetical protein
MRTRNFAAVQLGADTLNSECKRDLDSKLQLRHGVQLNTSRPHALSWGVVGLRIAPSRSNDCAGDLCPLNRETASCHSGCRNMGGSPSGDAAGRAREDIPTHRPTRKENVRALCSGLNARRQRADTRTGWRQASSVQIRPSQSSEPCGFPFALFLFRLKASHFFLRGTCFCFVLSLVFPFSHFGLTLT